MRKNQLTKHCAMLLLAIFATAWSTATASVTVNVKRTDNVTTAPYLYAWTNNDGVETVVSDPWPGTQLSATTTDEVDNDTWYTKTFSGISDVYIIINDGNDTDKTGNIHLPYKATDNSTTNWMVFNKNGGYSYYTRDNYTESKADNLSDKYDIPAGVTYEPSNVTVYFINTNQWDNPYAYISNGSSGYGNQNNDWPGDAMTKVGTNSNGWDVYKWSNSYPNNPSIVIFSNNGSNQTGNLVYTQNGYYSGYNATTGSGSMTTVSSDRDGTVVYNTPAYFTDANMRAALEDALGVPASESNVTDAAHAIATKSVKVLDISNHSITNTTGISYFSELDELYANNNDITFIDLQNAIKLRVLDLHQNENLLGFGTGDPSSNNHIVRLPSGCLQYIDMSKTRLRNYAAAAFANKVAGTLETFIARDVYYTTDVAKFAFNSVPSVTTLTKLKYLDVSGCDGTPVTIVANLANMKSTLKYLDLSNQHMSDEGNDPALDGFTALKTFKFNTQANWTKALTINNCPALTYIDVSGNVKMTGLTVNNCGITSLNFPEETTLASLVTLATLDVSNNPFTILTIPATPTTLTTITASNCSSMTKILAEHNASKLRYVTAQNCPVLTDITINGADIYFQQQNNAFDATNKSTLVTLDLRNDLMSTNYALDGFSALTTVDFSNSYMEGNKNTISTFTATNCPSLTTVNLGSNMKTVTLSGNSFENNSYPAVTIDYGASDVTLNFSNNNFTSVPSTIDDAVTVLNLNSNQLSNIIMPDGSNVKYLYAQSNSFASDYTLPVTSLVGLDLGNNGFTKFTATMADAITDEWAIDYTQTPPVTIQANADESDGSNTTLQALHLGGNTSLETVTVNGFKGLTKLASDNDMTSDKGKGLYVKDNTAIKTLDISNNRIEILGQDGSLSGLSALEELNASHNKILTLTNRSAISAPSGIADRAAYGGGTYNATTCPNIEDLTGLKKLNLSYNLLSDSIHLAKNTALEWLDVSHNRTITERAAGLTQYYRDTKDGTFKAWNETTWTTEMDQYTNDLNDTIGLRMLDLYNQAKLEYLDISYTNIENTAKTRVHVNNRVGPENLTKNTQASSGGEKVGRWGVPRFVLVNHCSALVEFHTNYNAMKSLGIGSEPESYSSTNGGAITGCPNLEVLEAIECRGQDPKIMQGEITISQRNPKMRYYNVKNSNFDKVNPYSTLLSNYSPSGQNLETLIVDGNYTKDNASHWNLTDAGTLDVSNNPKLVNLQANKCPNLITVKANGLADLDIVSVTQDTTVTTVGNEIVTTKLANLYVDHDAILDEVIGLETLSTLSVYHANDSHFTGNFVMPSQAKATLTDLRVGNEALSNADTRNNLTAVNLNGYTAVQHLETQNNPSIKALDITGFKNSLAYIDFANNHIDNDGIGIDNLSELPALTCFNCSNDSKWSENAGNSLTDLILTQSTGIQKIFANNNDLHKITGSFSNLTNIEFAHNHINGIDLRAASENENLDINGEDNGRDILADCAYFAVKENGEVVNYKVYFFQLDPNVTGNGTVLTMKESEDSEGTTRHLGTDGLVMDNITDWTSDAAELTSTNSKGTISPDDMSALDPEQVPGTIVVLKANENGDAAYGTAKYSYDNGTGTASSFYLKWESSGTPTAISEINAEGGVSIANTYGDLTITGKDGTVVGVYDLNGRQVASETISGGKLTIDGLSPGIYIVNGVKVLVK